MAAPRVTQYLEHIAFDDKVAVLGKPEGEDSQEQLVDRALSDDNRNCLALLLGRKIVGNSYRDGYQ
jgi:hypothetical protein